MAWRWPNLNRSLRTLRQQTLTPLLRALLEDVADVNKSTRDRMRAAGAIMSLPGAGVAQAQPLLAAAEGDGGEALPRGVALALLRGLMKGKQLSAPMRFLLKPANIARHSELGIRPLQVSFLPVS